MMKNLMITGGCGFIGSNLIRYILEDTDYKGNLINVDKLTYAGNPENLEDIRIKYPNRYKFEKVDIGSLNNLSRVFDKYEFDAICHLAAESHVDRSIVAPDDFIKTNIIGTYNLLECSRKKMDNIKLFHHVSTDEVFGSLGEDGFFTEVTSYRPNSPYSASKASSDHLVRAYNKTYGLPVTISNCSNNYGPYQFPEKLIPLIILNALEGKELPVYGDGKHIRDWLYVTDHCSAIWEIMSKGKKGETYNIGGNNEMENIRVVKTICDIIDEITDCLPNNEPRINLIVFVKDRPGHDRRYAIDFSKIKSNLAWQPIESFGTGIRRTINWYLKNLSWVNKVRTGEYQKWNEKHNG